ncbi:MAG: TetR family transcriptional regulator [Desulfuromonas sp.]|nr:MAG: TetR family transcriptional regulator [Desulfuromonas sp.]
MTVKQKKRGRPSKLTREAIVLGAKEWMLEQNKKLSIRALASHLEVDPMAIYHYFDNKAALLEAITISIMQGIYTPGNSSSWQMELTKLCHSYLSLLRDHPGLLETLLSMGGEMAGPAEVFRERFDLAIAPLSLEESRKNAALDLLVDYMHGFALALHCAKDKSKLEVSAIERPLALYLSILEVET